MANKGEGARRKKAPNLTATARPRSGGEGDEARPAFGSGAPIGLSMADHPEVGEQEDSLAARMNALQEQYGGGVIERQPVGVVDGKLKYRFVFHMPDGAVLPMA